MLLFSRFCCTAASGTPTDTRVTRRRRKSASRRSLQLMKHYQIPRNEGAAHGHRTQSNGEVAVVVVRTCHSAVLTGCGFAAVVMHIHRIQLVPHSGHSRSLLCGMQLTHIAHSTCGAVSCNAYAFLCCMWYSVLQLLHVLCAMQDL